MALAKCADSRTDERQRDLSTLFGRYWNAWGMLLILAPLMIGMSIANPRFLTFANLLNILKQSAPLMLISLGLLVVLVTGHIDLTVGVFIGLSGALLAGLSMSLGPFPAVLLLVAFALVLRHVSSKETPPRVVDTDLAENYPNTRGAACRRTQIIEQIGAPFEPVLRPALRSSYQRRIRLWLFFEKVKFEGVPT